MKTIILPESAIRSANIISDQNSSLEIRHLPPHAYILTEKSKDRRILSFESVNFSRLLSEQNCSITNALFSERRITMGAPQQFNELSVQFANRSEYVLSESGRIHAVTAFQAQFPEKAQVYAPQSMWNIPNNLIPDKMLLTGRLIDMINAVSAENDQLNLLQWLQLKYFKHSNGTAHAEISIECHQLTLHYQVTPIQNLNLFDLRQ